MKEVIRHAAVKAVGGFICIGKCHADCFFQGKNLGLKMSKRSMDQGFMTNKGRYVNRSEAAKIAKRAKQIHVGYAKEARKITHLLSEDIWYGPDVIYCSKRGYCKVEEQP